MTWRRVFWYGLLAALGWGLYLALPPKPRWVLPLPEVPLHVKSGKMLTVGVDTKKHNYTHRNYGWKGADLLGPIRLRDLQTGRIIGSALAHGKPWRLRDYSDGLRFVSAELEDQKKYVTFVLEKGGVWIVGIGFPEGFSPIGAYLANRC